MQNQPLGNSQEMTFSLFLVLAAELSNVFEVQPT
jgi:hypothetical protein